MFGQTAGFQRRQRNNSLIETIKRATSHGNTSHHLPFTRTIFLKASLNLYSLARFISVLAFFKHFIDRFRQ